MTMTRRTLTHGALFAALFGLTLQFGATARADDGWIGYGVLKGGKGYVDTPMGEVHYRDVGPRNAKITILLLHMTPMSMIQYAEVQPELAAVGIRSVAVDTPGYGMSDPPPQSDPKISEFADNLIPVLDYLKLSKVVIAGHHTGSSIATSFAARYPDRVSAIILHGVPIFTKEEIAQHQPFPPRTPQPDGSHISRYFHPPAPGAPPKSAVDLKDQTWFAISLFLEGRDVGHAAVFEYDMLTDFKAIKAPGMIMTDTGEAIHAADLRAAKLRPEFVYKEFTHEDAGGLSIMAHPKEWAKAVAEFATSAVK